MIFEILGFCTLLQSMIGVVLMTASTMKFREPLKKRVVFGLIAMLLGISTLFSALFARGMSSVDSVAIVFILAILFAWFLICSSDIFFVSAFNYLTYLNIYVMINYFAHMLTRYNVLNKDIIEYIVIRSIIYVVVIVLLFKFIRTRFRLLVNVLDKKWRVATLIPLIFLILQIFLLYYPVPYWRKDSMDWNRLIIIIVYMLFASVYYLFYIQASAIIEEFALKNRQLLMVQQEKLWEAEISRQKTMVSLALQQRHDMHHHNAVVMNLLNNQKLCELKVYMKNFDKSLDMSKSTLYSNNTIINSICNTYAKKAEKAHIKIQFNIIVPEQIGIENVDLTCILSNAIENAIEGCLRLQNDTIREINVTAKYVDERLGIHVENTCRDDIIFDGELPKTQKQGGGTGIHSIIYTAERYDGTCDFTFSNGKFYTHIVLNAVSTKINIR